MSYGSDSNQAQPGQQGGDKNQQAANSTAPLGDGGPAFPRPISRTPNNDHSENLYDVYDAQEGMSLRDYFAAAALQGELAHLDETSIARLVSGAKRDGRTPHQQIAFYAYAMADAMLAARKAVRP